MPGSNPNLVFVVGIVRSGTSLLYSLLNRHPDIALMYECDVWDFPKVFTDYRLNSNWLERQEFYNGVLTRHRLVFGNSLRGLEQVKTPNDLYQAIAERKSARFFGEKSPFYSIRLRYLARRHPGCSIILVWREPAEICRSVVRAGRRSRYFSRRGMLSRVIYSQEQMIRQTAELIQQGVRVHHVTYANLVDHPELACRDVCRFLGVEFDTAMLDLQKADFSAVYDDPHHEHLRRGVIQRQQRTPEPLSAAALRKIDRFQARWNRLIAGWLGRPNSNAGTAEPGAAELLYHRVFGRGLNLVDDTKRLLFEFLPLNWLQTYRRLKAWYLEREPESAPGETGLIRSFRKQWFSVVFVFALLAGAGLLDWWTGPEVSVAPLYLFPPALLALLVNRSWGKWAAALAAGLWTGLQLLEREPGAEPVLLAWNFCTRFISIQALVLLMDRVRREIANAAPPQQTR